MAKNVSFRGKKEVAPAEGRIPYDTSVWQARDSGDYIHTLTGEVRDEDQFDFNATAPATPKASGEEDKSGDGERDASSSENSDWDEYSQDTSADFGGAQMKTAAKSAEGEAGGEAGKGKTSSRAKSKKR